MAEVLGIISSITAIAAAGFKISTAISTVADEWGTAGLQIRAVAANIKALAWILEDLKAKVAKVERLPPQLQDVLHEILALCKADIDDINRILVPLIIPEGQRIRLGQKAKWLFAKSKVTLRQASLDSLRSTLDLFLRTFNFIGSTKIE
jgi:hypothetical protein